MFREQVYSRIPNEIRLPAYIGVGSNRQSRVPPNSAVLKLAGLQLFFEPLDVHLQSPDFFVKWSREFFLALCLVLFPCRK